MCDSIVCSRLGSLVTVCDLRQLVMFICYLLMRLGDSFLSGLHICHCLLAAPWAPEWASLIHFLWNPSITHKVTFELFNLVQCSHFIIETQRHHGTFLRSHSKWVAQSDQSWGFIPLFIYSYRHMFIYSTNIFEDEQASGILQAPEMQQWTRWTQRLPALGSHSRGADERGWTMGLQTVLSATQSTKSYQVRGWCGEVAGATLGKVAKASLIVTFEPAASPGEAWVWAWVWGPGEDPRWACSRIRDELHELRPRSELEGEEAEGDAGAATRSPALAARPFILCTTRPQLSPSHWIRFTPSSIFSLLSSSANVPHMKEKTHLSLWLRNAHMGDATWQQETVWALEHRRAGLSLSSATEPGVVLKPDSLTALHPGVPSAGWS